MNMSKLLPVAIFGYLLFSMLSITVSQVFLFIALIGWMILLIKKKQRPQFPLFFWALIAYSFFSLFACAMSDNPSVSFKNSRELLLFLIVPITFSGFQKVRDMRFAHFALLASALLSIIFSFFYSLFVAPPGERVAGFMGHYMTQAGLLMLFSAFSLSHFLFLRGKIRILWGIAFCLTSMALLLTLTRNAWIGLIIIASTLLLLYKPKALIVIPVLAAVTFAISPQHIKRRALSTFSLKTYSNAQRIEYLKAGIKIIKDYPVFGTGPNTVDVVFQRPKYQLSEEARQNVHLHNNCIQIGAERGIPTLIVWGFFMVCSFFSLTKLLKNKDPLLFPLTAAALASLLALTVAGLFEYNFGDSEVMTLFLYLITIPFAAKHILASSPPKKP